MRPLLFLTLALCAAGEFKPDEGPAPDAPPRPWPRPTDREPPDDWSERTGIPSPFPSRAAMVWCDSHKTDRLNPDGTNRGTWVPADGWFGPDDPRAKVDADRLLFGWEDDSSPDAPNRISRSYGHNLLGKADDRGWRLWACGGPGGDKVLANGDGCADRTTAAAECDNIAMTTIAGLAGPEAAEPRRFVEGAIGVYTLEATAHEVASVLRSQFIEARVAPVGAEFGVFVRVQAHVAVATVDPAPLREAAEQLAQTAGEALAAVDEVVKGDGEPA